jgi:hypothetical protein
MRPLEHSELHPPQPQAIYVEVKTPLYCCGLGNFIWSILKTAGILVGTAIGIAISPILIPVIWINEKIEKWRDSEEG